MSRKRDGKLGIFPGKKVLETFRKANAFSKFLKNSMLIFLLVFEGRASTSTAAKAKAPQPIAQKKDAAVKVWIQAENLLISFGQVLLDFRIC